MRNTPTPGWIDITAEDAPRLRRFYTDLFGWNIEVDDGMDYGLLGTADGPPAGGIGQAGGNNRHPAGLVAYFPVEDVDTAISTARRLGASLAVEPWEIPGLGRMAVLTDPEGNRIGLISQNGPQ